MHRDQRIRDPIYDLIKFSADRADDRLLWRLIQAPELQRLRRIRQLGFSEIVYPGATNTRFSHALGAMQLAHRMISVLERNKVIANEPDQELWISATLCAALLHDVGHGPFSHVFEEIAETCGVRAHHEDWTREIIRNGSISAILEEPIKHKVLSFFEKEPGNNLFSSIISSQLDVDRMDFLARDRHFTGVRAAAIDLEWILDCLRIEELSIDPDSTAKTFAFVVNPKGLSAIENYLFAYSEMYLKVYFHKTTRAAQFMLSDILKHAYAEREARERIPDGDLLKTYFSQAPEPTLECYLALDDNAIWSSLSFLSRAELGEATVLSRRLLSRDLYKCFDPPRRPKEDITPTRLRAFMESLKTAGIFFHRDKIPTKRYKQYDTDGITYLKNIFVFSEFDREPRPVVHLSPAVEQLPDHPPIRFYFRTHAEREAARNIWQKL